MQFIFSNIEKLKEKFKEIEKLPNGEREILKSYFNKGGLVKTLSGDALKIVYPDKEKIKKEIEKAKAELTKINEKVKMWHKTKKEAENYLNKMKFKKFTEKVYWKHIYKQLTDKKYKEDFAKTKIPVDLIADPKLKKIVEEFMKNDSYRDKLIETMDHSIIYKNKGIGQQIIESINIKKSIAQKKLELFEKRKKDLEDQIKAYKIISRWVVV